MSSVRGQVARRVSVLRAGVNAGSPFQQQSVKTKGRIRGNVIVHNMVLQEQKTQKHNTKKRGFLDFLT